MMTVTLVDRFRIFSRSSLMRVGKFDLDSVSRAVGVRLEIEVLSFDGGELCSKEGRKDLEGSKDEGVFRSREGRKDPEGSSVFDAEGVSLGIAEGRKDPDGRTGWDKTSFDGNSETRSFSDDGF
jgi:hypothetical protein